MIVVMVVDVMFLVESCDGIVCSCDGCDVITLFESDNKKLDVVLVLSSKLGPNSCLQLKISPQSVSVILFLWLISPVCSGSH